MTGITPDRTHSHSHDLSANGSGDGQTGVQDVLFARAPGQPEKAPATDATPRARVDRDMGRRRERSRLQSGKRLGAPPWLSRAAWIGPGPASVLGGVRGRS